MRILIVSALFPPDVAEPAPYVKTLARKLATGHDVTVVTYGAIPEAIDGVAITTIPKHLPPHQRLWRMYKTLTTEAARNDAVLVNNAPSVELPAWFASWHGSARWYLIDSDTKITYTGWRKWLHSLVRGRLQSLPLALPEPRPEQHPFYPPSEEDWSHHTQSWENHLAELKEHLV